MKIKVLKPAFRQYASQICPVTHNGVYSLYMIYIRKKLKKLTGVTKLTYIFSKTCHKITILAIF